jgi:hypothetical protein
MGKWWKDPDITSTLSQNIHKLPVSFVRDNSKRFNWDAVLEHADTLPPSTLHDFRDMLGASTIEEIIKKQNQNHEEHRAKYDKGVLHWFD